MIVVLSLNDEGMMFHWIPALLSPSKFSIRQNVKAPLMMPSHLLMLGLMTKIVEVKFHWSKMTMGKSNFFEELPRKSNSNLKKSLMEKP